MQDNEIQFIANGTLYNVSEASSGWVWEVPVSANSYAIKRDSGKTFASATEAQQDALRDATIEEEYTEQDEDDYHRAQHRIIRSEA